MIAPSWDTIRKQVDEAASKAGAAAQAGTIDNRLTDATRMGDLMTHFFVIDPARRINQIDQDELATVLAAQVGMSREAAVKTLAQWRSSWEATVTRYDAAVAEAKDRAAKAAIVAKHFTVTAAAMAFGLMLVGFFAATLGGVCGSMVYRGDGERDAVGSVAVHKTVTSYN